jgi:hypothetical protein
MRMTEMIQALGHSKIKANHPTTLEITKDPDLTERGDCIIAVCASKGSADLCPEFSELVRNNSTRITLTVKAGKRGETIVGRGDNRLTLSHPTDLVARKSNYVCPRTVMVEADKSASDLDRRFVETLRNPHERIMIELVAELQNGRTYFTRASTAT